MNLFKLKKDGKTVGYLKIEDGRVWIRDTEHIWRHYGCADYIHISFDETLPYVTDDKHGEKVFAGDKVNYKCCGGFNIVGIACFVWNEDVLGWALQDDKRPQPFYYGIDFDSDDIELIRKVNP